MKKALITGITGQDGSFLSELLLNKGYEVHGLVRRASSGYGNLRNIIHLVNDDTIYRKRLFLHSGDMGDSASLARIISELKPDELYNLAAQADVQESNFMADYTLDINGNGVGRVLDAVRQFSPKTKVYQASTSELFGDTQGVKVQNEETTMRPQSPYSIGKLAGFHLVRLYREAYGIFACNGILFNHESERRGDDYLTRKATKAVGRIKAGLQKELRLGNLKAYRDWGYSPEFMEAAWTMLQQDKPNDYVIGTGETHTVEDWVIASFERAGLYWKDYVKIDKKLYRPAEVDVLQADYTKAKNELGWSPKIKFKELVNLMTDYDIQTASREARLIGE